MLICIATIRNKAGDILKYRMLDTSANRCQDISKKQIGGYIQSNNVRNLDLSGDKLRCLEGNINEYPIIKAGTLKNNIAIIISTGSEVCIANYEGKVVTLPYNVLTQKISNFANGTADAISTDITIVDTINTSDTGTTGITQAKPSGNIDYLSIVMEAPVPQINLQGFNVREHYKEMGISDNVYRDASSVYKIKGNRSAKQIENDESAYSFDIVQLSDRVELRGYTGNGYRGLVKIPDKVTHICKNVFNKARAEEIEMPNSVVFIGEYAFSNSHVKKVKLSPNVTAIPLACFFNSDLEEIDLTNITSIDNMAFCGCNIQEVKLVAPVAVSYKHLTLTTNSLV